MAPHVPGVPSHSAPADGEEIQRAGEETQRTGEEIQRVEGEEGEQQKLAERAAQDAEVVTPKVMLF